MSAIFKSCFAAALLFVAATAHAKVTPSAWIGNGMVLQRGQVVTLSGTADAGEVVTAFFDGQRPLTTEGKAVRDEFSATADADGRWSIALPAMKPGGPFTLSLADTTITDVLVGDVYLCSGQSNMELPVYRVMDMFSQEVKAAQQAKIRLLQVKLAAAFDGPAENVQTDGWKSLDFENAKNFSALAYFFAREMYARTKVPIAVVQSAVGGSPIEAWLSREELAARGADALLSLLDVNSNPDYRAAVEAYVNKTNEVWEGTLAAKEKALGMNWTAPDFDDSAWHEVDCLSKGWARDTTRAFNGAHWFRKSVNVTAKQASLPATLRLGMLVDADEVWVNGQKVGQTYYQYPPRIYDIPQGLLHEGKNVIAVRLTSQNGMPRFVADMYRGIFFGSNPWLNGRHDSQIDLDNNWRHFYAAQMPQKGGVAPFHYTPVSLYNAMIAPLKGMAFTGALWYQGESNVGRETEYRDLLNGLMADWRRLFANPELDFVIVGLADFEKPVTSYWRAMQKAQQEVAEADPHAVFAPAADLGVWYDIHPLDKKSLALRAASALMSIKKK